MVKYRLSQGQTVLIFAGRLTECFNCRTVGLGTTNNALNDTAGAYTFSFASLTSRCEINC